MNILVVNDDGYTAPGIAALVRELRKEHDVFVCAPKENQSAVGHGLTLRRLLHAEKVTVFDDDAKNSAHPRIVCALHSATFPLSRIL